MNKRHKWYNEIVAWANGAEIEYRNNSKKMCWIKCEIPVFDTEDGYEYRIKPQPKVKKWLWATASGKDSTFGFHRSGKDADYYEGNPKGELYTIKLLWSETEFEANDE